MATFNVDSLDFVDDEEARFGADADFATRFDSANSRLELEDLTNATVGFVPQNVGTDLVGGKLAETVAEGKALADDGNVYDSIQAAENAASSWVKVGPGDFRESVTIDTTGLTLAGSGKRTNIQSTSSTTIQVSVDNVNIYDISVVNNGDGTNDTDAGLSVTSNSVTVRNVFAGDSPQHAIYFGQNASDGLCVNCTVNGTTAGAGIRNDGLRGIVVANTVDGNVSGAGIIVSQNCDDYIVANNVVLSSGTNHIYSNVNDGIIIGNRCDGGNIEVNANDTIVANNRISTSGGLVGIDDKGTGTVLDANLVT